MQADAAVHLEARGLGKSFGATRALDDVSVAVRPGTVHAFVGENGAGKSTLGKIIAGVFPQDQGDLVLRGTTVSFRSPREALVRGIALVAQEVALVPRLTVAENVFLGAEPRRAGFIDRRSLRERFDRLGRRRRLRPPGRVGRRPPAARQAAAGRDPARAGPRCRPHRPRRAVRQPVDEEVERLHEIVRGLRVARPHGDPRLPFPHRGPRPVRRRHRPPRRPRRPDRPDRRRDRGSLVTGMLGRPVGRAYPDKRLPPAGRPDRARHRGPVRAGRRATRR